MNKQRNWDTLKALGSDSSTRHLCILVLLNSKIFQSCNWIVCSCSIYLLSMVRRWLNWKGITLILSGDWRGNLFGIKCHSKLSGLEQKHRHLNQSWACMVPSLSYLLLSLQGSAIYHSRHLTRKLFMIIWTNQNNNYSSLYPISISLVRHYT